MNFISLEHFERLGGTAFVAGDLLYCLRGSLGKMALVRGAQTGKVASSLVVIRPSGPMLADLMYHWLSSPGGEAEVARHDNGSAQPNLASGSLARFQIPVPPRADQARIVGAIEEAVSKLDAGELGFRTVRQLLERTQAAIRAAAVTGLLVPQDPAEAPAVEVLAENSVAAMERPVGAPPKPAGWAWCHLRSLAHSAGYGTSVKCGYEEGGVGVLRIPNIQRGALELDDLKRAPSGASISDDLVLAPGDLLIVRTNGSRDLIGSAAPVTIETGHSFASYLIRFRTRPELVRVEYLALMLAAPWWRRYLEEGSASSAGQYNLSLRTLEPLPVALPPFGEQGRILNEVERQMSFIDACERSIAAGLKVSAALRRSLLKAAFEGRLVPQDPTDEPASDLLERIRADRAANPKPKKRRARSTA